MKDLIVTILQYDIAWEDIGANLAYLDARMQQVPAESHIVVLPEMFATGFTMQPEKVGQSMDGTIVQWMSATARRYRKILAGSVVIAENGVFYNRLIWMLPDGRYHTYDKHHLFSFAGEDQHYSAGNSRTIVSVNGWKISLNVCYDLRFPVWLRQSPDPAQRYDVLLVVANWPERRSYAWNTLLKARAIENLSFVVGVNRVGKDYNGIDHSGDSAVISPLGEVLWTAAHEACMHTHTLQYSGLEETRQRFAFLDDMDPYIIP